MGTPGVGAFRGLVLHVADALEGSVDGCTSEDEVLGYITKLVGKVLGHSSGHLPLSNVGVIEGEVVDSVFNSCCLWTTGVGDISLVRHFTLAEEWLTMARLALRWSTHVVCQVAPLDLTEGAKVVVVLVVVVNNVGLPGAFTVESMSVGVVE